MVVHDVGLVTEWAMRDCIGDVVTITPSGIAFRRTDGTMIMILNQFMMYFFMARTRIYWVKPGETGVSNILKMAREGLRRDRRGVIGHADLDVMLARMGGEHDKDGARVYPGVSLNTRISDAVFDAAQKEAESYGSLSSGHVHDATTSPHAMSPPARAVYHQRCSVISCRRFVHGALRWVPVASRAPRWARRRSPTGRPQGR